MKTTRRTFVAMTAAAAGASAFAAAESPVRLGGPIFLDSNDPVALAREHRRLGYSAAYVPQIATLKDPDLIRAIRKAYSAENVWIAEVGRRQALLERDERVRVVSELQREGVGAGLNVA